MSAESTARAPLVTVLMPAYNAAQYIGEAITSVLNQTLADFELVVVDDGSTDGTVQQVQAFTDPRIVLVRQPQNGGEVAARNAGIERARGTYIAMLDADDLADPARLATQVSLQKAGADRVVGARQDSALQEGRQAAKSMDKCLIGVNVSSRCAAVVREVMAPRRIALA